MKDKSKKSKKKATKTAVSSHYVARPSHKKPRPKKYVEPKIPDVQSIPEKIDAPKEVIEAVEQSQELQDIIASLKKSILEIADEEIMDELGSAGKENFETIDEQELKPSIKIEVELPPGKTEQDVVHAINVANNMMRSKYDAAIDEISNLYGEEYHTRGLAWGAGDKVKIQKVEPNIVQDKQDLIDLNKDLMKILLDTRPRPEPIPPRIVRAQKEGFFTRLAKWLWD